MNIISKLYVVQTPEKFPSMVPAVAYAESSQPVDYAPVAFARKYYLTCTVGTSFIANDATYAEARKDAERMIHVGIFRDIIPIVYKYKDAIRAGDPVGANKHLNEILHLMNGGEQ